jgi:hypothetical protein
VKSTKKAKLFREEVKDRHTNHWDLDMVSRDELEQLMSSSGQQTDIESTLDSKNASRKPEKPKGSG